MLPVNIKYIIGCTIKHVKALCIVFVALLSISVSLLLIGSIFKNLVDKGITSDHIIEIHNAALLISILIITFAIGSFFRSYFINLIATRVISEITLDVYRSLLKVNIIRYETLKVGDIISRLTSDTEIIGDLVINFLSFFIRNFIMLFGALILMFIQSTKLSLIVFVLVPILLVPLIKLIKRVRTISREVMIEKGNLSADISETFSGIRTLYAYNQQEHTINKFQSKINEYIKNSSIRHRLRSIFFTSAIGIISGSTTSIIWIGSIDIISGHITSGEIISFIYYAIIAVMSAGGISELFSEIQRPLAALDRIIEFKNMVEPCCIRQESIISLDNDYSIELQHISFSYPSQPNILVLNNISFDIQAGSFTGIVGCSGSGKSTLMQLIMKFYKYNNGNIRIGKYLLNNIDDNTIRKKIAYVEQYPSMFSGTIRSNISFSKPSACNQEIEYIADLCGVTSFTDSLEFGLDTRIGEKGVRISGGQKQRIAIARALLYEPEVLMLDEATSALDNNSEKKLIHNIRLQLKEKIIISIAHRLSSIENADKILVINQGSLINQGNHNDLLKHSKIYQSLYKKEY